MRENTYTRALSSVEATELQKAAVVMKMRVLLAARLYDGEAKATHQIAAPPPEIRRPDPQPKRKIRRKAAALAACLVLAAAVATPLVLRLRAPEAGAPPATSAANGGTSTASAPPPDFSHLPTLAVEESPFGSGGMGFEGYTLYDFSEFGFDDALYTAAQAEGVMPVYRNAAPLDRYMMLPEEAQPTEEELRQNAKAVADKLGVEVLEYIPKYGRVQIGEGEPYEAFEGLRATIPGGEINPGRGHTAVITFNDLSGIEIGTPPAAGASIEDHRAYLQSLTDRYAPLLDYMEKPTPGVWMNRTFAGEPHYSYYVYDAAGSAGVAIAHRWLAEAVFGVHPADNMFIIRLADADLSEKIGDYPIITEAEARAQLLAGQGATTAPEPFPGEAYIAATDMVYFNNPQSEIFIPYYKFYVQLVGEGAYLPDDSPEGLTQYGAWYVPAVQPEFLQVQAGLHPPDGKR